MKRIYDSLILMHFNENRQMVFLTGPRQVGKTTTSQSIKGRFTYTNWDNQSDRLAITGGPEKFLDHFDLRTPGSTGAGIIFDEIHKYSKWKTFLKGFFDSHGKNFKTIVTGSARMNVFKRGGDSLMGRYFLYRMHPLSIRELKTSKIGSFEISDPIKVNKDTIDQLLEYGGFPEPFLKNNRRFYNRWKKLRLEQFFYEDLRDITNIQEVGQIEILAKLLESMSGQLINFTTLSREINVSVDTIRRWIGTLDQMYYLFSVKPWYKNVPKSLRKQPKIYLWDWSILDDKGARNENFVASHLLKAVQFWNDSGLDDYGLYFLRDKMKREVDFLVTKKNIPWMLVEVKSSERSSISSNLHYYKNLLKPEYSFQINFDSSYIERDCFSINEPIKVPVSTFLSQLI